MPTLASAHAALIGVTGIDCPRHHILRVGDASRGFEIVADEVGDLAQRTGGITLEIEMIGSIQLGTGQRVYALLTSVD